MIMNNNIKILNEDKLLNKVDLKEFVVNTREIYNALVNLGELSEGTQYRVWINNKIDSFKWQENKDYTCRLLKSPQPSGTKELKIYFITKEASLLLRQKVSPDGLEIQKKTNDFTISMAEALKDPIKLGEMLIAYGKQLKEQQKHIETLTTNIKKLEGNDLDVLFYAKEVGAELGISAIKLNRFLEEQKVIYKQNGHWHLYLEFAKDALFREVKEKIEHSNMYVSVLKITPKGRLFIKDLWDKINGN